MVNFVNRDYESASLPGNLASDFQMSGILRGGHKMKEMLSLFETEPSPNPAKSDNKFTIRRLVTRHSAFNCIILGSVFLLYPIVCVKNFFKKQK